MHRRFGTDERLLMAMDLHDRVAGERPELSPFEMLADDALEQHSALCERTRDWPVAGHVARFVAQDGEAARLEDDDAETGGDGIGERCEQVVQVLARGFKQA